MKKRINLRVLGVAILLALFGQRGSARAGGRQLAVVVNRASPLASLSTEAIRTHFLKHNKEWPSGEKVRPVQQDGPAHAAFLGRVLKMSSVDYERYWLERKYAAAETPPKAVDDDVAVLKFVGAMKGAIGYVDAASLDDRARSQLKVVYAINF